MNLVICRYRVEKASAGNAYFLRMLFIVSLARRLGHAESTAPAKDGTAIPDHSGSRLRSKERKKKIALGHKADGHEGQREPDLSM